MTPFFRLRWPRVVPPATRRHTYHGRSKASRPSSTGVLCSLQCPGHTVPPSVQPTSLAAAAAAVLASGNRVASPELVSTNKPVTGGQQHARAAHYRQARHAAAIALPSFSTRSVLSLSRAWVRRRGARMLVRRARAAGATCS